ncbi:hypothetical protein V502_10061, partial [Pseudogymnoascus sp. VKM F-4520 (FW-2644)]
MVAWEQDDMREDGKAGERGMRVTSLLDRESSGWYPEYWEFVKALSTVNGRGPMVDWIEYLPTEAIGMWPVEYAIDSLGPVATVSFAATSNVDESIWVLVTVGVNSIHGSDASLKSLGLISA